MQNISPGTLVELDDGIHDCVYGRTLDEEFSVRFDRWTLGLVVGKAEKRHHHSFPKSKVMIGDRLVWIYDADLRLFNDAP
jgi:hypothetical protein